MLRHSQPAARMHGFIHVDYFCEEKYETARGLAEIVNGWLSVLLTTHRLIIYLDSFQCQITLGTTLLNCRGKQLYKCVVCGDGIPQQLHVDIDECLPGTGQTIL